MPEWTELQKLTEHVVYPWLLTYSCYMIEPKLYSHQEMIVEDIPNIAQKLDCS